jgi:hypothetical protein
MPYQAKVRKIDNIVVSVESATQEWADEWNINNPDNECFYIRTWFDAKDRQNPLDFRGNFAGIGYTYDPERDAFIAPKLFNKWILNEETCQWEAPIPYPTDGLIYVWNDNRTEWEEQQ